MRRVCSLAGAWLCSALAWLGGPASAGGLCDWQARRPPRLRLAASPYPNFLLEILPTDPDLGSHRYRVRIDTLGLVRGQELGRGHFYTRRGGFLDLAHIRRTIDFAGYVNYWVRESLRSGAERFSFESIDRTVYHVRIRYPEWWTRIEAGERERLAHELALRKALEAAYDFSNWREILTWHGFHNVPGMPERGSAFSFEDLPSHAVGVAVAERALRAAEVSFDTAVTRELERELAELEIVPRPTCLRALELVAGSWWGEKTCLKRFVDTGREQGWIEPWLVRGLEPGPPPSPKRYPVPGGKEEKVFGYDCRGMIVLECEPRPRHREIRERILPSGRSVVVPARDYPAMLEQVRREVLAEFGPAATEPWP